MNPDPSSTKARPSRSLVAARVMLGAALAAAGYLASLSLRHGSVMGCGVDAPCHAVLMSKWAHWLGMPVSLPALPVYAALLISTFLGRGGPYPLRWRWDEAAAGLIVLSAGWFIALQWLVIRSFCPWCVATHLLAATAAVLVWRERRRSNATTRPGLAGPLGVAAVLLGLLVAGQLAPRRSMHAVRTLEAKVGSSGRALAVHQFEYPLTDLAMDGTAEAKHFIVCLFDYTCPHCRHNHGFLEQVRQEFGPDLAVVYLPVPMDRRCNKFIEMTAAMHEHACDYARLGMAVWKCDPARLGEFNRWLFKPEQPPPLMEARVQATRLVNPQTLLDTLVGKWPNQQIERGLAVFEENMRAAGQDELPQIMVGSVVTFGELRDADTLARLIAHQFELKRKP